MKCIICGKEKSKDEFSKEHIIPDALGNKELTTYSVCKECNNKLGAKVDSSFVDHNVIKIIRQQLGLRGKKDTPIKLFSGTMRGDDGRLYNFNNNSYQIHPIISNTPNGIKVEAEDYATAINLLKKKFKRNGKSTQNIEDRINIETKKIPPTTFTFQADVDTGKLVCFFVKIAYEFAYLELDDKYYDDPLAKLFRNELYETAYNDKQEHEEIKPYLNFNTISLDVMHQIKDCNGMGMRIRHALVLHPDGRNNIVCHVFLFLEEGLSFCICVSETANEYNLKESKFVMINEDGRILSL